MEYGYIRVSTREQNWERQRLALRAFGIGEKQIYMDTQQGNGHQPPHISPVDPGIGGKKYTLFSTLLL